jgi:hypothetical protein
MTAYGDERMHTRDSARENDPDYQAGLDAIAAAISAKSGGKVCRYHPQGGQLGADLEIHGGSFISGAVFALGSLGDGKALPLDRSEIVRCSGAIIDPKVALKIDAYVASSR